ncbi:hypothetical protein [Arthrobacter sp. D2-10]
MSNTFGIEHINQIVEITYTESQSEQPLRIVGRLQGFYDNGKGVQWWMAGRSTKRYATHYSLRALPHKDPSTHSEREAGGQDVVTPTGRLCIKHLRRLIEISYTVPGCDTLYRIAGRLQGFDESPDGLELWMDGRSLKRKTSSCSIVVLTEANQSIRSERPTPIELVGAK